MFRKMLFLVSIVLSLGLSSQAPADLVGWWKFDEGSGNTAVDSSGFGYDGILKNMDDSDWVDGVIGRALRFDGTDDYVSIPPLDLVGTNTLTISAWIKRDGDQVVYTGIVFNRDNNTQAGTGIGFGSTPGFEINHELFYCWDQNFWQWDSGLIVPNNQWVFVVLVIEPTKATLYLGHDGTLSSATHEAEHGIIKALDGVSMVGYDNYDGSGHGHGYFKGWVDEIRIYDHSLDANEIKAIYGLVGRFDRINEAEISRHPNEVLQKAYENLQQFSNWRSDPENRTKHADEIAGTLLIIAKAKEAKKLPPEEVLKDYYELIEQFPDSPKANEALCKVVLLDKENGLEYVNKFLEKDPTGTMAVQFYGTLAKKYLSESDYTSAEKYIKLFIDKYSSTKNSLDLMSQLISSVGQCRNHGELSYILDRCVSQDPNSPLRCAVFRYRASELFKWKDFHQLCNLAWETRAKFPGTRLAATAAAVLADKQYEEGNYIRAIEELKPDLFASQRSEPNIIRDIDEVLTLYQANTLRTQGMDLTKVYEAIAKHTRGVEQNLVALHCYEQGAKAGGFGIQEFKKAASETTKHCNTSSDNEIWFWNGLFAAERGDLTTAAEKYERFLKNDDTSVLAARAYYDLARARMVADQYTEAEEAVRKAKTISPCPSVIQLEQDLKRLCVLAGR